jgi:transcriptional regulator GlxA family with amidase domain
MKKARKPVAKRVVIIASDPAQLLTVWGPIEVLAEANRLTESRVGTHDASQYDVEVIMTESGADVGGVVVHTKRLPAEALADRRPVDTLIIAGGVIAEDRHPEPSFLLAVRRLIRRARRVASICTGAFVLAAAGALNGRRATTHWRWCDRLEKDYPLVTVERGPFYVRDGNLWTSAGVTAGIDLTLALVRVDQGHGAALAVARRLLVFLHRPGSQRQFTADDVISSSTDEQIVKLVHWIRENMHRRITVATLADFLQVSERQLHRIVSREEGVSPAIMVEKIRLEAAKHLLEGTKLRLPKVTTSCGFGSEETMRRTFLHYLGIPPGAYRERFGNLS